jgi:hypothetical protein
VAVIRYKDSECLEQPKVEEIIKQERINEDRAYEPFKEVRQTHYCELTSARVHSLEQLFRRRRLHMIEARDLLPFAHLN